MKKKLLILILFLFIITGCSAEYTLDFSNKEIKENINITILDSDIPKSDPNSLIEPDDRITPFIKGEQYPVFNNKDITYNKKVDKNGNITTIKLDYNYTHQKFKNSTVYKTCFENASFESERKNYVLNFSGSFYCLYGKEIKINIKTNNKVNSHNADKVSGNTYTWIVNQKNVDDTNILMDISKESKIIDMVAYIILGIALVVIIIFGYRVYTKIKKSKDVNEI